MYMGSGMLGLPFGFQQSGFAVCRSTFYLFELLISRGRISGRNSYHDTCSTMRQSLYDDFSVMQALRSEARP